MIHEIKIEQPYLIHILDGKKKVEVRKNDRDYQVGDKISFLPLVSEEYDCYHLDDGSIRTIPYYRITHILADFEGLRSGWVALSIEQEKDIGVKIEDVTGGTT